MKNVNQAAAGPSNKAPLRPLFTRGLAALAACLLSGGCGHKVTAPAPPPPVAAPQPTNTPTHYVHYYPRPLETRKRLEFFGQIQSTAPTDKLLPLKDFKLISYRTNGDTEVILTAPDCVLHSDSSGDIVNSAGPLHAETGDGNFAIDGTGFFWQQDETNSTLVISNQVVTTIQKGLLTSGGPPTNTAATPAGSNDFVHVFSDHFFLDRNASLVTFSDNVRAEGDQLQLRAEVVTLYTNGGAKHLEANTNVVIVSKANGSRATGDHAEYSAGENGAQLVTLTGNPRWQSGDGLSEGTARAFVFDGTANTFQAQTNAHFRVGLTGNSDTDFILAPQSVSAAPAGSPKFADVGADNITVQLPAAKGLRQQIMANGHVVIVEEAGGGRATADRAVLDPEDALQLTGHAEYRNGESLARAESLSLNQKTKSVFARTNAMLRFPPSALGQSGSFGGLAPGKAATMANGIVQVTANSYDFQDGVLAFHENVKASYLEAGIAAGTLDCGLLSVNIHSNLVERITAEQNVRLRQPPTLDAKGKLAESSFDAQRIEIQMRTNVIESLKAFGGITANRTETAPKAGKIRKLGLTATSLSAQFLPNTNQVESATANGDVHLTDDAMTAEGAKLDYTSGNDTAILTGNPVLQLPGVHISAENGIVYDHAHDVIRVQGRPQTLATFPVTGSNLPGFSLPGKSERQMKTP